MRYLCSIILIFFFSAGCEYIPKPDAVVICFGESSTAGAEKPAYPELLAGLAGMPIKEIDNAGQSGETTQEGLDRLNDLITFNIYPNATIFLYWEGGNNVADFIKARDPFLFYFPLDPTYPYQTELLAVLDDTQADIETAISIAQSQGWTVYVANYYPILEQNVHLLPCDASPLGGMVEAQAKNANAYTFLLNLRIGNARANAGVPLVNISAEWTNFQSDINNYHDCTHLSSQGNQIVADVFFNTIPLP